MKKKVDLPKVEPVKIKPLFGIKPNIWISACYLIGIILVIFIIGFLPDIVKGFKLVTFTSNVNNAAVYVDGNYVGGTPFTAKIKSGKHTADFMIAGQSVESVEFKISHPVFFNWLFPRKAQVVSTAGLKDSMYENLTKTFLEDVANYSAILSYDSVFRYRPVFSDYAKTLLGFSNPESFDYKDVLFCASAFITTIEMLEDAVNAYKLLNIDFDFSEVEKAVAGGNFKKETEHLIGLSFPGSSTISTEYFSRNGVSVNGFTFDYSPVSEAMYYYFVKENPKWAESNKENLMSEGLVDEYYLAGISLSSINTSKPVRNISYHAATAFCKWLSEKTGKEVYLPEELQWMTGSRFLKSEITLWEFTSTPYVPLLSLFNYSVYDTLEKYNVEAEVIVKGGSYVSDSSKITEDSIGVVPLSLCSDYMGFRIAWR